jgi:hypothetical protein
VPDGDLHSGFSAARGAASGGEGGKVDEADIQPRDFGARPAELYLANPEVIACKDLRRLFADSYFRNGELQCFVPVVARSRGLIKDFARSVEQL